MSHFNKKAGDGDKTLIDHAEVAAPPAPTDPSEKRVVDPQTGAAKGQKLARFDLIPARPLLALLEHREALAWEETARRDLLRRGDKAMVRFWARQAGSEALLELADCVIALLYPLDSPDEAMAHALWALAEHYGRGSLKYADRNWEKGYSWSLTYGAMHRHWWKPRLGEEIDPDTKSPHLIAVLWHVFAFLEFKYTHPEKDDRPGDP